MAIKYNPYGWEIRPRKSDADECLRRRNEAINEAHALCDALADKTLTTTLCDALRYHMEYMRENDDEWDVKFDKLYHFDKEIAALMPSVPG